MINWLSVAANSFWIAGLAVIVAGFSYHQWLAGQRAHPLSRQLSTPSFQRVMISGLLLIGIGLAGTSTGLWQLLPAIALIIISIIALVTTRRRHQGKRPGE